MCRDFVFTFVWSAVFAGVCWFETDEAKGPKYIWDRIIFWIIFAVLTVLAGYCAFCFLITYSLSNWAVVLLMIFSLLLFAVEAYLVRILFHKI